MAGDTGLPQRRRGFAGSGPSLQAGARGLTVGLAAPRMARSIITAVLFGYVLNTLITVWGGGLRGLGLLGFAMCLSVAFFLQLAHSTQDTLDWRSPVRILTLSAQAAVTFIPFTWVGPQAGAIAGFLAGSMLLAVAGPWRWGLFSAVGAGVLLELWSERLAAVNILYGVYFTLLTGLMVYGVSSLASLVGMVYAARGELARMAVVRERLRVARDLHDLLGYSISAMTLKFELAYRLLPGLAERARQELQEVLGVARRALADMRVAAGGYRPMSLVAEVGSAESTLAGAEIQVRVDVSDVSAKSLPEALDTVLAIVLREALTNVLRHSKAQQCVIEAALDERQVRLRVGNDGVEPDLATRSFGDGSGLENLASRLATLGGQLSVTADGEWFQLTAEAPLLAQAAVSSKAPGDEPARSDMHARRQAQNVGRRLPGAWSQEEVAAQPWHLRVARNIAVLVLSGYGVLIVVNVLPRRLSVLGLIGFAACVAVLVGVQIVHSLARPRLWPKLVRGGTLSVQAAATAVPLLWIGGPWGSMGGFFAGSLLLVVAGRWRWGLYAAVGVSVMLLSLAQKGSVDVAAYLLISNLLTGLVVYGISSLSGLVTQVDQARGELARMAATRERLRVARDLQDLLGHDLSAMTAKSELAFRLLPQSAERAKAEVADGLDIARRAAADVRSVASGYRRVSFTAEVDLAVSTLAAAGVDVQVEMPGDVVPERLDAVLAVALREAATNVLRHSDARRCVIAVVADEGWVRMRVANDGAQSTAVPGVRSGRALGDLTARLRSIGGQLTAQTVDGSFQLTIDLPSTAAEIVAD
jgi:signal transduction histidine kinase